MDRSDSLYIGLIIVGFVVSLGGMALLHPGLADDGTAANMTDMPYDRTVEGDQYTAHPADFYTVCLGYDCLPALYDPHVSFTSVPDADEWLRDGDLVISMELDGERYGFPLRLLQYHPVVNTVVEDQPITVTYDPYSGHHAVYSRILPQEDGMAGSTLSFGVTGQLWNGNLIMVDQETGSYWSQYQGQAVYSEKTLETLDRMDAHIARWSLWSEQHPNSTILDRPNRFDTERYADNPYAHYRDDRTVPVDDYPYDDPFHPKTMVHGVSTDGQNTAFREATVHGNWPVQDTVGNVPILLVQDELTGAVHGYDRRVDGETLTFHRADRQLRDDTGTTWTVTGNAVNGTHTGKSLEPIDLHRMYWFSWQLFHPDTDTY